MVTKLLVISIARRINLERPVIGVSCNFRPDEGEDGNYSVDRSYTNAIYQAGGMPQIIPILPRIEVDMLLNLYDGILLSGGGGLLPHVQKMKNLPGLKEQNPARYTFEYELIHKALQRGIPLLGICRGHQMINDVTGGSVVNLATNKHRQNNPSNKSSHVTEIKQDSKLFTAVQADTLAVNSFHSQVIEKVGQNLTISAFSDDGYIEGIEGNEDNFVMGVQFHPEFMIDENGMLAIYTSFVDASSQYKNTKFL